MADGMNPISRRFEDPELQAGTRGARVSERLKEIVAREIYNRTSLVDATIETVTKNLLEGALLVIPRSFPVSGKRPGGANHCRRHSLVDADDDHRNG